MIIHANPHQLSLCQEELSVSGRLHHTRDSGCQTDDFLIACKFLIIEVYIWFFMVNQFTTHTQQVFSLFKLLCFLRTTNLNMKITSKLPVYYCPQTRLFDLEFKLFTFCNYTLHPHELRIIFLCSPLSLFSFQVQLLPPEGALELSGAIREFLPLCPIQREIFLPLVTSQTQYTPRPHPMVGDCAPVACHERVDV